MQNDSTAEVQDRKGRGKGVGSLLEKLKAEFDEKVLPPYLQWSFDQRDDEQDEQQADIWNIRSQARERDLRSGATTVRAERERMLEMNEISQDMFNTMELADGRLPDGMDVLYLFYTTDSVIAPFITIPGYPDPADINKVDPAAILPVIQKQITATYIAFDAARTANIAHKCRQAMTALERLRSLYEGALLEEQAQLDTQMQAATELNPDSIVSSNDQGSRATAASSSESNGTAKNGNFAY